MKIGKGDLIIFGDKIRGFVLRTFEQSEEVPVEVAALACNRDTFFNRNCFDRISEIKIPCVTNINVAYVKILDTKGRSKHNNGRWANINWDPNIVGYAEEELIRYIKKGTYEYSPARRENNA